MNKNESWFYEGRFETGSYKYNLKEFFNSVKTELINKIGMNKTLSDKLPQEKDFVNYLLKGMEDYFANYDFYDREFGKRLIIFFLCNKAEIGSVGRKLTIEVNSNYAKIFKESADYLSKKEPIHQLKELQKRYDKVSKLDRTKYEYDDIINDAKKIYDSEPLLNKTQALKKAFNPRKHRITKDEFNLKFDSIYEKFRVT